MHIRVAGMEMVPSRVLLMCFFCANSKNHLLFVGLLNVSKVCSCFAKFLGFC